MDEGKTQTTRSSKISQGKLPQAKERYTLRYKKYTDHNSEDEKRNSLQHIIIKTLVVQNEERVLKATREKTKVKYKGKPITVTTDFSMEILKAKRVSNAFHDLKYSEYPPRLMYLPKLSATIE